MNTSVLTQALALYTREGGPQARTFEEDLAAFIHTGRVYITPTCILLAKAVPSTREYHEPWDTWQPHECDAWLVWLAAGDLAEFFQYVPYPLPWLVWARRNRLRRWPYETARRHILQDPAPACMDPAAQLHSVAPGHQPFSFSPIPFSSFMPACPAASGDCSSPPASRLSSASPCM